MANQTTGGTSGGGDDDVTIEITGVEQTAEGSRLQYTVTLPGWLQALRPLTGSVTQLLFAVRRPVIWVVAVLLGIPVTSFTISQLRNQTGPLWTEVVVPLSVKGPIAVLLDDFLYRTVLLPFGIRVFTAGVNVLTGLVVFLFGPDLAVGRPVGLVDSPFALSGPIASTITGTAAVGITALHNVFLGIAVGLEPLGLAAPTVAAFLWAVVTGGFVWAVWTVIRTVDVPLINPVGFVLAVSRPLRNLLGAFR